MKIQSKVFKLAHKAKSNFKSWSEALKFAWSKVKFQIKLATSKAVSFSFIKKDGSTRPATGTLQVEYQRKATSKPSVWYIVKYFDLDKNSFRSFDFRNLIK